MAPQGGANGVLPMAVLQKNAPTPAPRGPKAPQPRLKLVLRRLPPGLTRAELEAILGEDWKLGGGKVDWVRFEKGKVSKDPSKPSRPARAYFHVTAQAHVAPFGDFVRQTSFNDAARTFQDPALIGPPALEFAPYHKIPGRRRNDARQGLIDQDPEFKEFLESLTNPVPKPTPTDVTADGKKENKVITTPLIEALREKKANKDKSQMKLTAKHGRGDSKDDTPEKSEKKLLSKPNKDVPSTGAEKSKRMSKSERAAKEAVKILSKEASAAQAKEVSSPAAAEKASPAPAPERKRGSTAIAKSMLQRDLGIGPAANRKRGAKREGPAVAQEATPKEEEASQGKQKAKEPVPSAPAPVAEKLPKAAAAKKESTRPSRAERRAFKAALGEKTNNKTVGEDTKAQGSKANPAPPVPVILKKPQTQAQNTAPPAQPSSQQPPKGPAASRVQQSDAAASKASPPSAPTGPAGQSKTSTHAPVVAQPTANPCRQAFLKHANPSQGITEPLIEEALKVFGAIEKVEIDKRKGFAYVDFAEPDGLQKAIAASPVKVAQGAVQVLERKEKPARNRPHTPSHHTQPPTGPSRGRGGFSGRGRGRGSGRGPTVGPADGVSGGQTPAPSTAAAVPAATVATAT